MNFLNSIFYKSLVALYNLNINKDGRCKSVVIDTIWQALLIGKDGLNKAKLEMALESASGTWLDFWGVFFGVNREYEEIDNLYRVRIIDEVLAAKNTKRAIQEATSRHINRKVKDYELNPSQVKVFEPWTQLLKLDSRGFIDGEGRLISYDYWNYGVIDITIPESSFITYELISYLKKIKTAGVQVIFSLSPEWDIAIDSDKDSRDVSIYRRIEHEYYLFAEEVSKAFKLRIDGASKKHQYNELGHLIDETGYIDGSSTVLWEGVNKVHNTDYATGVLRNHLGSLVINLYDYFNILNKSDLTIDQAIKLDDESIKALDRLSEGRLTYRQDSIDLKRVSLINEYKAYIRYEKEDDNSFIFDSDNISSYLNIDENSEYTIDNLNNLLLDSNLYTNTSNGVKSEILKQIDITNNNLSKANPILIKTEKLGG